MSEWKPIRLPESIETLQIEELRHFENLWTHQKKRLAKEAALETFQERMRRWWSIENGIIEKIYNISDGITLQLIEHGFEAGLIAHGETDLAPEELIAILNDHRDSLDLVMDVAGGTRALTPGWIRELHAMLTRHRPAAATHEYCLPEQVDAEMERLVEMYHQLPEWPELRAAWLHHAFTQIRPFQDGNGRVALALASIDFIKSGLFPMVVKRTDRDRYLEALRMADAGDLMGLIKYFADTQKSILLRALSEVDSETGNKTTIDSIVLAAIQKQEYRKEQPAQKTKDRISFLIGKSLLKMNEFKLKIQSIPDIQVRISSATKDTMYLYRSQLTQIGKENQYWADMNNHREWIRMQLQDGGVTDIVVACHMVGNPSTHIGVAALFIQHRAHGERFSDHAPMQIVADPLSFSVEEDTGRLQRRFHHWLEEGLVNASAHWLKFL